MAEAVAGQNRSEAELRIFQDACEARLTRELPPEELAALDGRRDPQRRGELRGTIYNPTAWTVTALEVQVWTDPAYRRVYQIDRTIPPRSAGEFWVKILDANRSVSLKWRIVAAQGYPPTKAQKRAKERIEEQGGEAQPKGWGLFDERKLEPIELQRISGRGGPSRGGLFRAASVFSGTLYNGNPDLRVTEVTLRITTQSHGNSVDRTYRVATSIEPESSEGFEINWTPGDAPEDFKATVVEARGEWAPASAGG